MKADKILLKDHIEMFLLSLDLDLLENEEFIGVTDKSLIAASSIFLRHILEHMWFLQEKENMPQEVREAMATEAGRKLREFVNIYTGIDLESFLLKAYDL